MRYDPEDDELQDGESTRVYVCDTFRVADADLADHRPGFRYATDAARAAVRDARQEMIDKATSAWSNPRDANPPQFTCPECHGTGRDPDGDSPDDECDECGGTGSIRGPNRLSSSQRRDPGKYPDADLKVDRRRSADAQVTDARKMAYDAYVRRISQSWKRKPARDAAEPDNSSPPEVMRRFLRGGDEPDHDAPAMLRRGLRTEPDESAQAKRDRAWQQYKDRLGSAYRTNPAAATRIEQERERYLGKFER
jgi:hypothetical protein